MDAILNPTLYGRLRSRFGSVLVANAGAAARVDHAWRGGRLCTERSGGEQYRVCCPACGDRRYRLYVSYLWGSSSAEDGLLTHLYCCFNENCQSREFRPLRLRDELQTYLSGSTHVSTTAPGRDIIPDAPVTWPGRCLPITAFPVDHYGQAFFRNRGYDPVVVEKLIGACICVAPGPDVPGDVFQSLVQRIVLPIVEDGRPIGYQARYVPPADPRLLLGRTRAAPKYLTSRGLAKSRHLYGYDRARVFCQAGIPFGIVVESILDCLRLPTAVAVLGHTISRWQRDLLCGLYHDRAVLVAFDADSAQDADRACAQMFSSFRGGAWPTSLPPKPELENLSGGGLLDRLVRSAADQGAVL